MDAKFLNRLVDAGFKLKFDGNKCLVATANSTDLSNGTTPAPVAKIKLPISLSVRYYPNQNKTTNVFAPKNPPRVKINNINQKFDTLEEYREFLYESYDEALERIRDKRQEKIDNRMERHADLQSAQEEVAQRGTRPPRTLTPTEEAWFAEQKAARERHERLVKQQAEQKKRKLEKSDTKPATTDTDEQAKKPATNGNK